jgi:hypothetical protein
MVTWQTLAIAFCTVLGLAGCGIGGITIFAGGMSDNATEAESAEHSGCIMGAAGMVLLAIAFLLRLS